VTGPDAGRDHDYEDDFEPGPTSPSASQPVSARATAPAAGKPALPPLPPVARQLVGAVAAAAHNPAAAVAPLLLSPQEMGGLPLPRVLSPKGSASGGAGSCASSSASSTSPRWLGRTSLDRRLSELPNIPEEEEGAPGNRRPPEGGAQSGVAQGGRRGAGVRASASELEEEDGLLAGGSPSGSSGARQKGRLLGPSPSEADELDELLAFAASEEGKGWASRAVAGMAAGSAAGRAERGGGCGGVPPARAMQATMPSRLARGAAMAAAAAGAAGAAARALQGSAAAPWEAEPQAPRGSRASVPEGALSPMASDLLGSEDLKAPASSGRPPSGSPEGRGSRAMSLPVGEPLPGRGSCGSAGLPGAAQAGRPRQEQQWPQGGRSGGGGAPGGRRASVFSDCSFLSADGECCQSGRASSDDSCGEAKGRPDVDTCSAPARQWGAGGGGSFVSLGSDVELSGDLEVGDRSRAAHDGRGAGGGSRAPGAVSEGSGTISPVSSDGSGGSGRGGAAGASKRRWQQPEALAGGRQPPHVVAAAVERGGGSRCAAPSPWQGAMDW
jgi:hypothetical protein